MPRIDERSNTDNAITDRLIEERSKDEIKKDDLSKFEKKMALQKQIASNSKNKETSSSDTTAKTPSSLPSQKMPPQNPIKEKKPNSKDPYVKNAHSSKIKDQKQDIKKENIKLNKENKKRDDIALDIAIKRKEEKDTSEGFSEKGSDDFFQTAVNMVTRPQMPVNETQKSAPSPKIPDAVLNQLVDQVFVGVNQKGLSQFIIELKGNVLGGGRISITAQNRQINLQFSGLDASTKALIRNSKKELMERFRSKNLSLGTLELL